LNAEHRGLTQSINDKCTRSTASQDGTDPLTADASRYFLCEFIQFLTLSVFYAKHGNLLLFARNLDVYVVSTPWYGFVANIVENITALGRAHWTVLQKLWDNYFSDLA